MIKLLEHHLSASRYLIVFCSKNAAKSLWVDQELTWFLKNRGAESILLAVTEGSDPSSNPTEIFSPKIIESGLNQKPWYDLRGDKNIRGSKIRNFDDELVLLAAHVSGGTADQFVPIWQKTQLQRRRYVVAGLASVAAIMMSGSAYRLWDNSDGHQVEIVLNEAPVFDVVKYRPDLEWERDWIRTLVYTQHLNRVPEALDRIDSPGPRERARIVFVACLARMGDSDRALEEASRITQTNYQDIAKVCALTYTQNVDVIRSIIATIATPRQRLEAESILSLALARSGELDEALSLWHKIAREMTTPADLIRARGLEVLRLAKLDDEIRTVRFTDPGAVLKQATFVKSPALVSKLVLLNIHFAGSDTHTNAEIMLLLDAANALVDTSQFEAAASLALSITNHLPPDISSRDASLVLAEAANILYQSGKTNEAIRVVRLGLAASRNIRDYPEREQNLRGFGIALARLGLKEEALENINLISNYPHERAIALAGIAVPDVRMRAQSATISLLKNAHAWTLSQTGESSEEDRSKALAAISLAYSRIGLYHDARQLVSGCNSLDKIMAYAGLLIEYSRQQHTLAEAIANYRLPLVSLYLRMPYLPIYLKDHELEFLLGIPP